MSRIYRVTCVSEWEIEAENVAQARRAAKGIRAIGEGVGLSRPGRHDRDCIHHAVRRLSMTLKWLARKEGE